MRVVVQKFGGTCVESRSNQAVSAERIMEQKDQGIQPVVVISAAGRLGQPYSTAELVNTVTNIDPRISPRELDLLMCCGEIISTVAMAHLLSTKGYDTIALTGGQAGLITDVYHGHARVIRVEETHILRLLQDGKMIFVTGFQGVSERHAITTLGEGGSDYTAVALAMLLAQHNQLPFGDELQMMPLQIVKEVNGVMSVNPKTLGQVGPDEAPRLLPNLSFDECVSMSGLGADVLQHRSARVARKHRIPIIVRNLHCSELQGTLVDETPAPTKPGQATCIPDIANLAIFTIQSDNDRLPGQLEEYLGRERLTHFVMAKETGEVRFAVKKEKYRDVVDIVQRILFLRGLKAEIDAGGWSLVSVAGERLRDQQPKWQAEATAELKSAGIGIFGNITGDLSISFLVNEDQRIEAVRRLHSRFVLK